MTEEQKIKIREARKKQIISKETCMKISKANMGHVVLLKTRLKISKANIGKKHSEETKKKISLSLAGKKRPIEVRRKISESSKGENGNNWRGGITPEHSIIRKSMDYRIWRKSVFARDNWTCVICKYKGKNINADHIKQFALFPELRFDINNGRTLCVPCHKKIPILRKL